MCSPSSNADPMHSLLAASFGPPREGLPPGGELPGAERFISEHAPILGPAASWFVRDLWRQAATQAHDESLQILEHARRYTPQRLDRACQRALLYHLTGLPAIQFILAEGLEDVSPQAVPQEAGQLTFPFVDDEQP